MARLDGEVALITGAGTGIAPQRAGSIVRSGRPPRDLAGEVEERILDAAAKVFLKRGFEGASVDEIADVARAGKPTDLCAAPWQGGAVRRGDGAHVREITSSFESIAPTGATLEERLASIAMAFLRKVLVAETVGLIRAAVAEARRFRIWRPASVGWGLSAGPKPSLNYWRACGTRQSTGVRGRLPRRHRAPLYLLPMLMRALFGEHLTALRAEIAPHVARTVAFFLAACRQGGIGWTKRQRRQKQGSRTCFVSCRKSHRSRPAVLLFRYPRRAAPSSSPTWRRASRRALRCGQPIARSHIT
jgi:AcrR family transcriptional regulator